MIPRPTVVCPIHSAPRDILAVCLGPRWTGRKRSRLPVGNSITPHSGSKSGMSVSSRLGVWKRYIDTFHSLLPQRYRLPGDRVGGQVGASDWTIILLGVHPQDILEYWSSPRIHPGQGGSGVQHPLFPVPRRVVVPGQNLPQTLRRGRSDADSPGTAVPRIPPVARCAASDPGSIRVPAAPCVGRSFPPHLETARRNRHRARTPAEPAASMATGTRRLTRPIRLASARMSCRRTASRRVQGRWSRSGRAGPPRWQSGR